MKIIIFLSLIAVAFSAETRIKVGSKTWALSIVTNEGKNIRKEYTDENGISHGTISFVDTDNKQRQLQYKCDVTGEEPDFSFTLVNENESSEKENTNTASNETSNAMTLKELNYEAIDGGEDFSGYIFLKVGKSVYSFNFISGDKTHAREEAFDENGMIYGKYTYFNEKKESKVIVNYKFNSTGSDPTFEVSMYKKPEKSKQEENERINNYYDPNRVNRRILAPNRQYSNSMPSVTLSNMNPPHNIITPMQGNWYYRVQ